MEHFFTIYHSVVYKLKTRTYRLAALSVLSFSSLLCSTTLYAQGIYMPMMLRPENLYFEVGVGQAEQTIPTIGFNNDASDTQTSIRIAIGQEEPTAINWMTGIDFGYTNQSKNMI